MGHARSRRRAASGARHRPGGCRHRREGRGPRRSPLGHAGRCGQRRLPQSGDRCVARRDRPRPRAARCARRSGRDRLPLDRPTRRTSLCRRPRPPRRARGWRSTRRAGLSTPRAAGDGRRGVRAGRLRQPGQGSPRPRPGHARRRHRQRCHHPRLGTHRRWGWAHPSLRVATATGQRAPSRRPVPARPCHRSIQPGRPAGRRGSPRPGLRRKPPEPPNRQRLSLTDRRGVSMTDEPPHSFMASEMAEQPEVLERLVARASRLRALAVRIAPRPLAGCAIVARGSSDHAALLGRYLFEVATGRPVSLVSPSVHTLYRAKVDYKGMLVLGVSQSGATPEIVEVLERLRDAGARTVALTDDPTSPLAAVAEEVVDLNAGPERAGPAPLDALPEAVAAILADDSAATAVAMQIDGTRHLATVARGYLFGAAIECALKIRETTGILATGWSAADLPTGPVG